MILFFRFLFTHLRYKKCILKMSSSKNILTILNVDSAKSFKYNLYKSCITSLVSDTLLDITIPSKLTNISHEDLNKYELLFIIGYTIKKVSNSFLSHLRKNYTGKIIGIHIFIENLNDVIKGSEIYLFD